MPIPLTAGTKLYDGKIPGDHHRDHALLARLQSEAYCNSSSQPFTTAHPILVAVSKPAIAGKRFPDIASLRVLREIRRLIRDFDPGRLQRRDRKLAVPLILNGSTAVAIEQDSFHTILIHQPITISCVESAAQVSGEAAEPAHHICPGEQH